jgi:hypothetical protein
MSQSAPRARALKEALSLGCGADAAREGAATAARREAAEEREREAARGRRRWFEAGGRAALVASAAPLVACSGDAACGSSERGVAAALPPYAEAAPWEKPAGQVSGGCVVPLHVGDSLSRAFDLVTSVPLARRFVLDASQVARKGAEEEGLSVKGRLQVGRVLLTREPVPDSELRAEAAEIGLQGGRGSEAASDASRAACAAALDLDAVGRGLEAAAALCARSRRLARMMADVGQHHPHRCNMQLLCDALGACVSGARHVALLTCDFAPFPAVPEGEELDRVVDDARQRVSLLAAWDSEGRVGERVWARPSAIAMLRGCLVGGGGGPSRVAACGAISVAPGHAWRALHDPPAPPHYNLLCLQVRNSRGLVVGGLAVVLSNAVVSGAGASAAARAIIVLARSVASRAGLLMVLQSAEAQVQTEMDTTVFGELDSAARVLAVRQDALHLACPSATLQSLVVAVERRMLNAERVTALLLDTQRGELVSELPEPQSGSSSSSSNSSRSDSNNSGSSKSGTGDDANGRYETLPEGVRVVHHERLARPSERGGSCGARHVVNRLQLRIALDAQGFLLGDCVLPGRGKVQAAVCASPPLRTMCRLLFPELAPQDEQGWDGVQLMSAPVRDINGRSLAVLVSVTREPRRFAQGDRHFLDMVAQGSRGQVEGALLVDLLSRDAIRAQLTCSNSLGALADASGFAHRMADACALLADAQPAAGGTGPDSGWLGQLVAIVATLLGSHGVRVYVDHRYVASLEGAGGSAAVIAAAQAAAESARSDGGRRLICVCAGRPGASVISDKGATEYPLAGGLLAPTPEVAGGCSVLRVPLMGGAASTGSSRKISGSSGSGRARGDGGGAGRADGEGPPVFGALIILRPAPRPRRNSLDDAARDNVQSWVVRGMQCATAVAALLERKLAIAQRDRVSRSAYDHSDALKAQLPRLLCGGQVPAPTSALAARVEPGARARSSGLVRTFGAMCAPLLPYAAALLRAEHSAAFLFDLSNGAEQLSHLMGCGAAALRPQQTDTVRVALRSGQTQAFHHVEGLQLSELVADAEQDEVEDDDNLNEERGPSGAPGAGAAMLASRDLRVYRRRRSLDAAHRDSSSEPKPEPQAGLPKSERRRVARWGSENAASSGGDHDKDRGSDSDCEENETSSGEESEAEELLGERSLRAASSRGFELAAPQRAPGVARRPSHSLTAALEHGLTHVAPCVSLRLRQVELETARQTSMRKFWATQGGVVLQFLRRTLPRAVFVSHDTGRTVCRATEEDVDLDDAVSSVGVAEAWRALESEEDETRLLGSGSGSGSGSAAPPARKSPQSMLTGGSPGGAGARAGDRALAGAQSALFSVCEAQFCEGIAGICSVLLRNRQQLRAIRARAARLRLVQAALVAAADARVDHVFRLHQIGWRLRQLLRCDRVTVLRVTERANVLVPVFQTSHGAGPGSLDPRALDLDPRALWPVEASTHMERALAPLDGDSRAATCARLNVPLVFSAAMEPEQGSFIEVGHAGESSYEVWSELCVPLYDAGRDQVIGVVQAANKFACLNEEEEAEAEEQGETAAAAAAASASSSSSSSSSSAAAAIAAAAGAEIHGPATIRAAPPSAREGAFAGESFSVDDIPSLSETGIGTALEDLVKHCDLKTNNVRAFEFAMSGGAQTSALETIAKNIALSKAKKGFLASRERAQQRLAALYADDAGSQEGARGAGSKLASQQGGRGGASKAGAGDSSARGTAGAAASSSSSAPAPAPAASAGAIGPGVAPASEQPANQRRLLRQATRRLDQDEKLRQDRQHVTSVSRQRENRKWAEEVDAEALMESVMREGTVARLRSNRLTTVHGVAFQNAAARLLGSKHDTTRRSFATTLKERVTTLVETRAAAGTSRAGAAEAKADAAAEAAQAGDDFALPLNLDLLK